MAGAGVLAVQRGHTTERVAKAAKYAAQATLIPSVERVAEAAVTASEGGCGTGTGNEYDKN